MGDLYINYRKLDVLKMEGQNLYFNNRKLERISETLYEMKEDTFIQLYDRRTTMMDEDMIVRMMKLKTEATAVPKEVIYTIENILAGYIYELPSEVYADKTTKESLQQLKRDMILLGKNHIHVNHLDHSNVRNLQITTPKGFTRARNQVDYTKENLDQVTDYYFRNLNCSNLALKKMIDEYIRSDAEYIGDYLEETSSQKTYSI